MTTRTVQTTRSFEAQKDHERKCTCPGGAACRHVSNHGTYPELPALCHNLKKTNDKRNRCNTCLYGIVRDIKIKEEEAGPPPIDLVDDEMVKGTAREICKCMLQISEHLDSVHIYNKNQQKVAFAYCQLYGQLEEGMSERQKAGTIRSFYENLVVIAYDETDIIFKGIWKYTLQNLKKEYGDYLKPKGLQMRLMTTTYASI